MKKILWMTAAGVLVATSATAAHAGSNWGFSYSTGYAPVYAAPAPVYVAPRPVYVAPQPIYYGPSYYAPYTPSFRVNYWGGDRYRGDWNRGRGHGRGHGHHRH